jgi:ribonuclease P protein component
LIWTIRGRRAFRTLARTGRTVRTETLWCTFLDDPAAVPLRVAFAVGRPIGSAVRRNRLRRRLRAAVRSVAADQQLQRGWLLIGAKPAASKQTFESLQKELNALLARAAATPRR